MEPHKICCIVVGATPYRSMRHYRRLSVVFLSWEFPRGKANKAPSPNSFPPRSLLLMHCSRLPSPCLAAIRLRGPSTPDLYPIRLLSLTVFQLLPGPGNFCIYCKPIDLVGAPIVCCLSYELRCYFVLNLGRGASAPLG